MAAKKRMIAWNFMMMVLESETRFVWKAFALWMRTMDKMDVR